MGMVTVSSSAAPTPLGLSTRHSTRVSVSKLPVILSFKTDKSENTALIATRESVALPLESKKENGKRLRKVKKRVKAVSTDEESPSILELDYSEAAAKLETIYKRSPATDVKRIGEAEERDEKIVRKGKRLNLEKRVAMRMKNEGEFCSTKSNKKSKDGEDEKIDRLVREYSSSTTDKVSLDWKKMKIPPVLPSSEHAWLFRLMQPLKEILPVKETLQNDLGRDVTHDELAEATNMDVVQLRKQLEVGRAARNKLIKHNLRLVLFVMNKYFQDFANGPRFQDLCQAGVKGLITAIDRFEPKRKFRLSTYALFWIRHAIIRSASLRSPLALIRIEIQRAKQELSFELQRTPTDEEIIERVGITPERYLEVMRASRPITSLNARHDVTQEEFIKGITDVDGLGGYNRRQPALFRLALDDVLDSLKPKESLVIRQRYGLDGKGDRTLGEIAANLNISREMVRKHEMKALMKLKLPARVDYLRRYIFK